MKTNLIFPLLLAATAANASQLTFTDTWHDTGGYSATEQQYVVTTTGSFNATISLPLSGINLGPADLGSPFMLAIGPAGDTTMLVSDSLGDATSFSASRKTATFPLDDPNTGLPVGTAVVSWTASTISVKCSATEDILGEEAIFAEESSGVNTAYSLNSALDGTSYEVTIQLDASDNGGGTYNYDNQYIPTTGTDVEVEYNPPDDSGPYPLEKGSISGAGDFTPPKVSIISPTSGFKVYNDNAIVNLTGLASDNDGITNVECYVNGETTNAIAIDQSDILPTNNVPWTAEVDLSQYGHLGTNVITVLAQDYSGNQATVARSFVWLETNSAVASVTPPNSGSIKGVTNNEILVENRGYKVIATPASKNWLFSEWTDTSGDVLSSNATLEYFDTDGTLTANFVQNPFNNTALAGTYTALFYDATNGANPSDAGYIVLTITGTGGYSVKLYLATVATPFSFSGQLALAPDDSLATVNGTFKASKSNYLTFQLQVATDTNLADSGAGTVGGFVNAFYDSTETNQIDSAGVQGELSIYNTNVVAGLYNVVINPVASDPSQGPGGWSFGSATIGKKGAVATVLQLADGVSPAISFSTLVAADGTCPLYASLYGGKGVLLGWMQFATNGSGDFETNSIEWVKLPVADKYYTAGFTATPAISDELYVAPKKGTNIFGWTNGTFTVDAGSNVPVTFKPATDTFVATNKVTIAFTAATGMLSGTFPTGNKFKGVEFNGAGYGFYVNTAVKETGPITISASQ
jgi:hypothetical protein